MSRRRSIDERLLLLLFRHFEQIVRVGRGIVFEVALSLVLLSRRGHAREGNPEESEDEGVLADAQNVGGAGELALWVCCRRDVSTRRRSR